MKQKQALAILKAGRNVCLTGPAGSGKTHILREYITYLRQHEVPVAVTASTGIAATHLGGQTIHSWSGIGLRSFLSDGDIDNLLQKEYLFRRYDGIQVIIIDEISMLDAGIFESFDRLCRAMRFSDRPFGGIQIVVSGDFFQLSPIAHKGGLARFAYESESWRGADIRACYLEEQHRQNDEALMQILGEIRNESISQHSRDLLSQRFKDPATENVDITRLYTHNMDVDRINMERLAQIKEEERVFLMQCQGRKQIVGSLKKGILAPERLCLKKGASVMFVKNNFEAGYANGTLGIVQDFEDDGVPIVQTHDGCRISARQVEWNLEENGTVQASVCQIPLRLAWAITVHKSQGMSLAGASMDLSKTFVHGQGYVALSRVSALSGLYLLGLNELALTVSSRARQFDEHLHRESATWERVLRRFDEASMQKMHDDFIVTSGGSLKKKKIEPKRFVPKKYTLDETLTLVRSGHTLEEIVSLRGLTRGTIIGHLEKLKERGDDFLMEKFTLVMPQNDLLEIKRAFAEANDGKLSAVYNKLEEKYSYEHLRMVRLSL